MFNALHSVFIHSFFSIIHLTLVGASNKEEYCEKCSRVFVDSSSLQWAAAVAGKYSPRRKHVREHAVIRRSVVRMRGGGRRQCAGTNTG